MNYYNITKLIKEEERNITRIPIQNKRETKEIIKFPQKYYNSLLLEIILNVLNVLLMILLIIFPNTLMIVNMIFNLIFAIEHYIAIKIYSFKYILYNNLALNFYLVINIYGILIGMYNIICSSNIQFYSLVK